MSIVSKHSIYLDNAASTPIDPRVKKEMVRSLELYGNPSSFNAVGRQARKELEKSRSIIAGFLGARSENIIFTSSGSEANSLAILGFAAGSKKGEILTTPIEHPSVLESLKKLSSWGWKITYLKIDRYGFVDLEDLEKKINPAVSLVSVIYANNEIGTIQPVLKISKIIKGRALLHVDACQATEYLNMNVNELGVDMLTFNSAKIYGPKGVGVLYLKQASLSPFILGGNQEHGLRAGTENISAISGMAKAVSLIEQGKNNKISVLRDYFIREVRKIMPDIKINGPEGEKRLANNVNISLPNLTSENLLLELDKHGIYASAGSACTARSVEPSHVLKAIGVGEEHIHGAIRFSLGRQTKKKDIDYVLSVLPKIIKDLKKRYGVL